MKKYMFLYFGPFGASQPFLTQALLTQWAQQAGASLVDKGTVLAPQAQAALTTGDVVDMANTLLGYSIIQTQDAFTAADIARTHPFLGAGNSELEIHIHELLSGDITSGQFQEETHVSSSSTTPTPAAHQPTVPQNLPPQTSPANYSVSPVKNSLPFNEIQQQPETQPQQPNPNGELSIQHDEDENNPTLPGSTINLQ